METRKTTWATKMCAALTITCLWNPLSGVQAAQLKLTETELKQYDGTDTSKPIYLAIDGTIFDVSASPAFYGPGGHYHHFVGKDASRAWVSECWDSEGQLTWRMDGIEDMYMPKYLDEQMQRSAGGDSDFEGAAEYGIDELTRMAKTVMEKIGKVSEKEIQKRRKADAKEAKESVKERLNHWKDFFAKNDKYTVVGTVVLDKDKPEPPKLCQKAMEKRPIKGGKLEKMMGLAGGGAAKLMAGGENKEAANMPDFVKDALGKQEPDLQGAQTKEEL